MSEYVEARSLAALNQLAANPPRYPTKPNERKQDALTLYISRVPGTRDIILSTLKPQIKNVTAEDVASSLYYVHFQTPEDEPLIPLNQAGHPSSPRSSGEGPMPRIHRKPLPNTSGQPTPGSFAPAAPSGKENQGTPGYRVPLSPRSPLADTTGQNAPPLPNKPRPPFHERPYPPNSPGNGHFPPDPNTAFYPIPDPPAGAYPLLSAKQRPFSPFSLTLIRRDPSSGQQWNVGKIASFQLENPDLIDDERRNQSSPSIQIHLETSGYAKFRARLRQQGNSPTVSTGMPASGAFERQVKMSYSPSFTASLRQHFRSRSSMDEGQPTSPTKRPGHARGDSHASMGSYGGDFDGSDAPIITQPAPGLKPRGYIFYSPWNGRCEFVTGKAGRTLKCRHVLPSYTGGVYNPLVEGSDPEHGDERADNTRPISELRFNLPSNELLADKKSTEGGVRTRDQIHDQFNKMVAKAQGLDDSDDADFHFDLSLGREKAGGGNRGKRAKMGKLIIFDEGLKMLDLAVAANIDRAVRDSVKDGPDAPRGIYVLKEFMQ
ncbi:hypothetical protein O1611_g1098 [Lasiodiplodia mahajangana]|uniref:Uncharacterized protein n=1 Tax=Lasiodiplodia mahajangana TaxID=1108764 RepID=A0ACC2JYZ4_9PEZI|nr:hypothetical protein O1611_g1098 [Lasiodiplodia mahajangana]